MKKYNTILTKKIKELSNENKFFLIMLVVVIIGMNTNRCNSNRLEKNGKSTIGIVTDVKFTYDKKLNLFYKFKAGNETYLGMVGIGDFYCDNGKRACIGSKFKVTYLPSNPEISEIDLEQYNKYKNFAPSF